MISFGVRYNPVNLSEIITNLPRDLRGPATEEAAKYLVGNVSHGLTHYPAYQYVTRARAYGNPFFSERQRRFIMAGIADGRIDPGYPHRTGRLQRGWTITYDGVKTRITNTEAYAPFVMGDNEQSRHEALAGWRVVSKVEVDNEKGMIQAADLRVVREIKERGL